MFADFTNTNETSIALLIFPFIALCTSQRAPSFMVKLVMTPKLELGNGGLRLLA